MYTRLRENIVREAIHSHQLLCSVHILVRHSAVEMLLVAVCLSSARLEWKLIGSVCVWGRYNTIKLMQKVYPIFGTAPLPLLLFSFFHLFR